MSDSTSNLTQLYASQAGKEITVNELFKALGGVFFGGRSQASYGLSWAYFGGRVLVNGVSTVISNAILTLTASSSCYIEATQAGVISFNTTAFTPGAVALYKVVTGAASVTSYEDHRPWVKLGPGRLVRNFATDANITLTHGEALCDILEFTSVSLSMTRNVIVPLAAKQWTVYNGTTGGRSLQFIGATGTGITVANGKRAILYADGTNIIRLTADI